MDRVGTTTQSKILNIVKYYKFKQPETLNLKKCYEGNRGELLIIATVQYFVQLMLQIVSDQSEMIYIFARISGHYYTTVLREERNKNISQIVN